MYIYISDSQKKPLKFQLFSHSCSFFLFLFSCWSHLHFWHIKVYGVWLEEKKGVPLFPFCHNLHEDSSNIFTYFCHFTFHSSNRQQKSKTQTPLLSHKISREKIRFQMKDKLSLIVIKMLTLMLDGFFHGKKQPDWKKIKKLT